MQCKNVRSNLPHLTWVLTAWSIILNSTIQAHIWIGFPVKFYSRIAFLQIFSRIVGNCNFLKKQGYRLNFFEAPQKISASLIFSSRTTTTRSQIGRHIYTYVFPCLNLNWKQSGSLVLIHIPLSLGTMCLQLITIYTLFA